MADVEAGSPSLSASQDLTQVGPGSQEEEEENDKTEQQKDDRQIALGGTIDTPAFALLVGVDEHSSETVSVPLTRLPAKIGRKHNNQDLNFFCLGKSKTLSRNHFLICYQDGIGGRLVQVGDDLVYKPGKEKRTVVRGDDKKELPSTGFFAIECLGRNKIHVNNKALNMGEIALLEHGTRIKVATFSIIFLLPEGGSAATTTIQVPNPAFAAAHKKKRSAEADEPKKEVKKARIDRDSQKVSCIMSEVENLPLPDLMERMAEAVKLNTWDRKDQMIGSAISLHAVRDAAKDPNIINIADTKNGVALRDLLDWLTESKKYKKWVSQMLTKVVIKSFHSSVSKSLVRAGYTRTGTTGRHVRWVLPPTDGENASQPETAEANSETTKQKKREEHEANGENEQMEDNDRAVEGEDSVDIEDSMDQGSQGGDSVEADDKNSDIDDGKEREDINVAHASDEEDGNPKKINDEKGESDEDVDDSVEHNSRSREQDEEDIDATVEKDGGSFADNEEEGDGVMKIDDEDNDTNIPENCSVDGVSHDSEEETGGERVAEDFEQVEEESIVDLVASSEEEEEEEIDCEENLNKTGERHASEAKEGDEE